MITNKKVKDKYYINDKEFRAQIAEYYETNKMTNELGSNIMKIAEGLSYNWRFLNYSKSWKEDMVGDAVIKMYAALEAKKYNLDLEFKPFSYFNQIAWHAFSNRIKKEKKQHDGLQEYKQMVYEEEMNNSSHGSVYVRPIMDCDEEDGGCYDD